MLGAIEAGGTKFVCAVSDEQINIVDTVKFATTTPAETLQKVIAFFKRYPVTAIGIGSFGPIGVKTGQADFGHILNTPKLAWQNFDFLGVLKAQLQVPRYWTTDVNIAAYGELQAGAAQGLSNVVYLTVGTGIGAGVIVAKKFYYGLSHTEVGHVLLQQQPSDHFSGSCPYHQGCAEGLASGPAIEQRCHKKAAQIPADNPLWQLEADYLAQLCHNITLMFVPERIIFGGGVMHQKQLFPLIRKQLTAKMNHYVSLPPLDQYIVPVGLGDQAGIIGGLYLAKKLVNAE